MRLGDPGEGVAEALGVDPVARQQRRQHVAAAPVHGAPRMQPPLDAEEAEPRERRALELLVGEHLDRRRMVERQQPHAVEIGDLAQLLGHPHLVGRSAARPSNRPSLRCASHTVPMPPWPIADSNV